MSFKLIGALCILFGCGGFGFQIAAAQLREENTLRQLIRVLDFMECELQYRLTPLPELCRQAAKECTGSLSSLFTMISRELEEQISPNVATCMAAAISKTEKLPQSTVNALELLGNSMGRFDLNGQLKGLDTVRGECRRHLEALATNKDVRMRSYKTLGLCAGAALVILFI